MHWRLIGFRRLEPRVGRHGYCSQECEFYAALKGLPITDQSPEEVEADTQARLRERSAFALGGSWRREG